MKKPISIIVAFLLFLVFNYVSDSDIITRFPIIFDDFEYSSISVGVGADSNSIFGYNPWLTDAGFDTTKGWYRWNTDEHPFGEHSFMKLTSEGFLLGVLPGKNNPDERFPMLHSTFKLRHGTFAAMVKFENLHMEDKFTQAFWMISPYSFDFYNGDERVEHFADEIDFEWNNWWFTPRKRFMSVGGSMRDYRNPKQYNLDCMLYDGRTYHPYNCDSELKGTPIIAGQWAIAMFVVDTIKGEISFSMKVPHWNNSDTIIYGGKYYDEEKDQITRFTIDYKPYYDMVTMFNMGPYWGDEKIDFGSEFEVDWFIYTPVTHINFGTIEEMVSNLKNSNITRANTVDSRFYEENQPKKGNLYFDGPSTAHACQKSTWIIKEKSKYLGGNYKTTFKYRYRRDDGKLEKWNSIKNIALELTPAQEYDTLELFLTVYDHWKDFRDTLNVKFPVSDEGCK